MVASTNYCHVRHRSPADRHLIDTVPPTRRRCSPTDTRTPIALALPITSNALPSDGVRQREYLRPRAFGILKEQKNLIVRTVSDPNWSQQHLISVMRKLQAGTSSLLLTDDYQNDEDTGEYKADDDEDTQQGAAFVTVAPPTTKSLSPEALHIMQQLETAGFEGTPREESDRIHTLIDYLPLSNFMTETAEADEVLTTRVGRLPYNSDTISQIVGGVVEQLVKAQWDSCASAGFESSMYSCDPNSFVALKRKILTADGGCYSDGMAWRRYHISVDKYMIALGDAYGCNLRQFDILMFAKPPFVASEFPTPVSVIAVPVAKGILIKNNDRSWIYRRWHHHATTTPRTHLQTTS